MAGASGKANTPGPRKRGIVERQVLRPPGCVPARAPDDAVPTRSIDASIHETRRPRLLSRPVLQGLQVAVDPME